MQNNAEVGANIALELMKLRNKGKNQINESNEQQNRNYPVSIFYLYIVNFYK